MVRSMDYGSFNQRVCTDQPFLDAVNQEHPTWEADAIRWADCIEEAQAWRERLQKMSRFEIAEMSVDAELRRSHDLDYPTVSSYTLQRDHNGKNLIYIYIYIYYVS